MVVISKIRPFSDYSWGLFPLYKVLFLEQLWGGAWLLRNFPSIPYAEPVSVENGQLLLRVSSQGVTLK